MKTALEWVGAITFSISGASTAILLLSKCFGNILATKLLEQDRHKYQQELEALKNNYQQELETLKLELEKKKAIFLRYQEHQFTLYNDLWKSLCDLKHISEELWKVAEQPKLEEFSKQLKTTTQIVEKSALLIEDRHYKDLIEILNQFELFKFNKLNLIDLRNRQSNELEKQGVTNDVIKEFIKEFIKENKQTKTRFVKMIEKLSTTFKRQIRGE